MTPTESTEPAGRSEEEAVELAALILGAEVRGIFAIPALEAARRILAAGYYRPGTVAEPDNHHNAAVCPYCSPGYKSPSEVRDAQSAAWDEGWEAYRVWQLHTNWASDDLTPNPYRADSLSTDGGEGA